jgi:polyphosphate kinase 2 (PPK2 family)
MSNETKEIIKKLQLEILRIQQGVYHKGERMIIAIEGVDASGKGGVIRKITENLDPRGFQVHPIGAPSSSDQGKHYLYRFWKNLPAKGMIAIFDRSWYGRVLVERIEKLTPKLRWERAYTEINQFEKLLTDDGVKVIKVCLKISKKEQLKRFEERLRDPYKQWKITDEDIRNRSKWIQYMNAYEDVFKKTSTLYCPWHVVETDNKDEARLRVLKIISEECQDIKGWIEKNAKKISVRELEKSLSNLR